MNKKESDYVKAEVLDKKKNKKEEGEDYFDGFDDRMKDEYKNLKRDIFAKGFVYILPYIASFILFFGLLILGIFILFDEPFDYIITGILLFFIFRFLWKVYKVFKK